MNNIGPNDKVICISDSWNNILPNDSLDNHPKKDGIYCVDSVTTGVLWIKGVLTEIPALYLVGFNQTFLNKRYCYDAADFRKLGGNKVSEIIEQEKLEKTVITNNKTMPFALRT